jgi:serine/threonine-protein phosphatase PP1 catalytic subunit
MNTDSNQTLPHIEQLIKTGRRPAGTPTDLTEREMVAISTAAKTVLLRQPILLAVQPPITICGDIHGQFHDLVRIFDQWGFPPDTNYLFLGDYVDRGSQSIETISLLLLLKIAYPENIFLLRGNHECSYINRQFGFYEECVSRYSKKLWEGFCEVFNCLPIAAIVDDRIFCVHGGISPGLLDLDDIRRIERPAEVPEEGLLCDILWSDPDPSVDQWEESDRGTSYVFGLLPVRKFRERFDFDLICRAHQAVMEGYDFPFSQDEGIITLFSAPNYSSEFPNKGAVLQVSEELCCEFKSLEPESDEEKREAASNQGTPPRRKGQAG